MKKTQKIFLIVGEEARKVLTVINHYEAVESCYDENADIDHIIDCNKNVAIESKIVPEEDIERGIIPIFVGNSFDDENNVINPNKNIGEQFEEIANKYDIDIGDYIPDGRIKQPSKKDCILCKIYENKDNPNKKMMDMIIYESENFYVCPAKGAMVEGYLIICPKEHVLSCAALPTDQKEEFLNVINDVKHILKDVFSKNIMMFEHGSGEAGKCKHEKSIVHACLHIIPTSIRLKSEQIHMKETSYEGLSQYDKVPYFWYIDQNGRQLIVADPEIYIPRQYARQSLAENMGIPGELWNWRKNDFKSKINDTLIDITKYLKRNNFRLSSRIQKRTSNFLTEMTARNDVL